MRDAGANAADAAAGARRRADRGDANRASSSSSSPPRDGDRRAGSRARRPPDAASGSSSAREDARWADAPRETRSALVELALVALAFLLLPFLRALVRVGAVLCLTAMYVNNPARDERGREGAWACLLAERRRMIASRDADSLKRFELFTFIKNQVGDAVAVVQGRRVLCDFALFALAWLESENPVDAECFALGALGTWTPVPTAPFRKVAVAISAAMEEAGGRGFFRREGGGGGAGRGGGRGASSFPSFSPV